MDSSSLQWANLGRDLLSLIAKCLDTRVDVLRFRAVCHSWRSSIPLPPKIPSPYPSLKLPFPISPNPHLHPRRRGYFLLKEYTVYAVQPLTKISDSSSTTAKTWIIKIEESKSGKVILNDPLFRFPFKNLNKNLPKVLNLLDYRVDEISKAYGLEFVQQGKAPELDFNELKSTTMIRKVVTSSNLENIGDGFAVMALHTGGKLGVWRMGDKKWNNINDNRERSHYSDIVYDKGKFYALDFTGLVVSVDPATLKLTELSPVRSFRYEYGGQTKYLLKSFGDLFRIDQCDLDDIDLCVYSSDSDDSGPVRVIVYKLDEEKRDWVQMEGLDDRVLFAGDDVSFSVLAKDFEGCKRNCVYYRDDTFSEENEDHPGFDVGIFCLEDGTSGPLSKFPGYSKIFWPPPTWLKSNPRELQRRT